MENVLVKNQLSLDQRIFSLEAFKRKVAETLRNSKIILKELEQICNDNVSGACFAATDPDQDVDGEDEVDQEASKTNIDSSGAPVVFDTVALPATEFSKINLMGCQFSKDPSYSQTEKADPGMNFNPQQCTEFTVIKDLPPTKSEETKLFIEEKMMIADAKEIDDEKEKPVLEITLRDTVLKIPDPDTTCVPEQGQQAMEPQGSMPRITSVYSQATSVPVKSNSDKQNVGILVENNRILPIAPNHAMSTEQTAMPIPPANKKFKLSQNTPAVRKTLTRLRSCPIKSASQKVDEWLRGFDPKFGTVRQWVSHTRIETETTESEALVDKPLNSGVMSLAKGKHVLTTYELSLLTCTYCKGLLSEARCPKSIPAKKLTCQYCKREMMESTYHRHMRSMHANIVKMRCEICQIPFPFSVIEKHMDVMHPATGPADEDNISGGTVLQDEPMIKIFANCLEPSNAAGRSVTPVFYPQYNNRKV